MHRTLGKAGAPYSSWWLSVLSSTTREVQRFHSDFHSEEWWGGPSFFFFVVAMVLPEVVGRYESMFCAHFCQHVVQSIGSEGSHPRRRLLRDITTYQQKRLSPSQMEEVTSRGAQSFVFLFTVTDESQRDWVILYLRRLVDNSGHVKVLC